MDEKLTSSTQNFAFEQKRRWEFESAYFSSSSLVHFPNGNVEKHGLGWFRGDPTIEDGSSIVVTKEPPPPTPGVDVGTTVKDVFAIVVSAATLVYLVSQVKK